MTLDEFWQHVTASRRVDPEDHADRLAARLTKLPIPEILSFASHWQTLLVRSYSWELWGAAYLINGGCSDDGFEYFRSWLILQGAAVFERAVVAPDSLADVLAGDAEVECECDPAYDAYSAVADDDDYVPALKAAFPDLPGYPTLGKQPWDFDDDAAMQSRYPKLYAEYMADHD